MANGKITKISDIPFVSEYANPDFNNLTQQGLYFIGDMTNATNAPQTIYGWVILLVLRQRSDAVQIIFGTRQTGHEDARRIWIRQSFSGTWQAWTYAQLSLA